MNLITWNMQGSFSQDDSKWTSGVRGLFRMGADVICLQECGAVPGSAQLQANLGGGLHRYTWGRAQGRSDELLHIVFYTPNHRPTERCNMAIVSRAQPGNPQLLSSLTHISWRSVVGASFGNTTVFSIHAISPGGADTRGLLQAVVQAANNNNNNNNAAPSWVVAGDFNRPPDGTFPGFRPNDADANRWALCPPNSFTHVGGQGQRTEKDYAVRSAAPGVGGSVVTDVIMSDHIPVLFVV
ncbi:MAG: endonuclease/exonuclease/phosphatase family protein [Myxococcaceae bacterium]|nr:endonuclease/exonuclease/phosphatase family protein [Myxococcaceae bacterium]